MSYAPVHGSSSWGDASDPPTYLPPDDVDEIATHFVRRSPAAVPKSAPTRSQSASESLVTSAPRPAQPRGARSSRPVIEGNDQLHGELQVPPQSQQYPQQRQVMPQPQPVVQPQAAPQLLPPQPQPAPRPSQAPLTPDQVAGFVQFQGGASFDPNTVPLPPELAPIIYGWVRRLALQADLAGADRLLRDALVELTSALSVVIVYPSPDGLQTLGGDDELPKDTQPIIAVATARRALVGTHTALVPIATGTETVGVIQLTRNPRQPAFALPDHVAMAALAREAAAVIHHLVVEHLQRAQEHKADKGSLYRPEALESHRKRGHEGVIAELSPVWVRYSYPLLVVTIVVAFAFAFFIHVPTYSTGNGVVVFPGTEITAPVAGTVETVYVQSSQEVRKGDLLIKLSSAKEDADLAQATTQYEAAVQQYLVDPADETIHKELISAQTNKQRAEAALAERYVRATAEGTVSDVRIREGTGLQFGEPILTIVAPGTEPEVWAFLPGSDRPRLMVGQDLQVDLTGYTKSRESAKICYVDAAVIGAAEARRVIGAELADALKMPQEGGASFVWVKAKLPSNEFKTDHHIYHYHHGMPAKTEVRVESKRFVVTLLPSLEKYLE